MQARRLAAENPDHYYANQYNNPANWQAHYHTTGHEIWRQTEGAITHFVAGLGTSGTFMGTTRRLKEYNPAIEAIASAGSVGADAAPPEAAPSRIEVAPTIVQNVAGAGENIYRVLQTLPGVGAVNNFRFNESPVDLLSRFDAASATQASFSREWGDYFPRTATPAVRVPDFNMSSVSQAQ